MDCKSGNFVAKCFLCLLNFMFTVAGIVAVVAGIWSLSSAHSFLEFLRRTVGEELITEHQQIAQPAVIELAAYILLAAGVLVVLISFLGYWGAFRESRCFLTCYGVLLILILLLEITTGILATTYTHGAEENTRAMFKLSIKEYYAAEGKERVTQLWDFTMAKMECCGVDSYKDFKASKIWTQGNKTVPEACCVLEGDVSKLKPKDPACIQHPSDTNSYWKKGCYNALLEFLQESKFIVVGISIGLVIFKLLVISVAFYLCLSLSPIIHIASVKREHRV
jgi:tetraspanin-18